LRNARVCSHVRFIEHTEYGLCYENNVAIFGIKEFIYEMYEIMAAVTADVLYH
jgi:hypothetical protein